MCGWSEPHDRAEKKKVELYSSRDHGGRRGIGKTYTSELWTPLVDRSRYRIALAKPSISFDLMLHVLTIRSSGRKSQRLVSGWIDSVASHGGHTEKRVQLMGGRTRTLVASNPLCRDTHLRLIVLRCRWKRNLQGGKKVTRMLDVDQTLNRLLGRMA